MWGRKKVEWFEEEGWDALRDHIYANDMTRARVYVANNDEEDTFIYIDEEPDHTVDATLILDTKDKSELINTLWLHWGKEHQ